MPSFNPVMFDRYATLFGWWFKCQTQCFGIKASSSGFVFEWTLVKVDLNVSVLMLLRSKKVLCEPNISCFMYQELHLDPS